LEYDPTLDVQTYVPEARALRGDSMKRACPLGTAASRINPPPTNPIKQIAYGSGRGLFTQNGAEFKFSARRWARCQEQREATYTSDLYYGSIKPTT